MRLWDELRESLEAREAAHLRRRLATVPPGILDMASNDYLSLAYHPEVTAFAAAAAKEYGAGARASRLVSGHNGLYEALEARLADFKGVAAALVFPSGYAANLGVVGALAAPGTLLLCHKRNHASLIDAARLAATASGVNLRFYESLSKLRSLLETSTKHRPLILTDGVFSMDGDLADLRALVQLAEEFDAAVIVDDAHGTGTLGETGRGICEHFGCHSDRILSKALGSQGGFVAGPDVVIQSLVNGARSFIYTTGLNPPAVAAALAALDVLGREPERVGRLRANALRLADELAALGFEVNAQASPILPVMVGESEAALALSAGLKEQGLWCPAIRPPTVAAGTARLRLTVSSEWGEGEWERIVGGILAVA